MPKHTLQDGEGVIIEIPNAARDQDVRSTRVRPGAKPGDPTELQGRRRARPSGIQFYDCGQILSGESYVDIPFSRAGTRTNFPGGKPGYVFNASDFAALEDYLFLTPLNQWASKYRKLTFDDGYKYPVDIEFLNPGATLRSAAKASQRYDRNNNLTSGTGWSAGGMARLGHTDFTLYGFLAFNDFTPGTGHKITETRDYAASGVSGWTIPNDSKIFLMPKIVSVGMYFEDDLGGGDMDYWFALAPYTAIPRAQFADRVISLSPEPNRPWLNYFTFINNGDLFSADDIDYFFDTFLNADARVYKAETRSSVTTWTEITHSSFPRASFEATPVDGLLMMTEGFEVNTVPLETTVEVLPGTLVAVITSGSQERYVWKD